MNILRDDRQNRLHMRFRCGAPLRETISGFLGQARSEGHSALEKTLATENVFRRFATEFVDPPSGAHVQPRFDEQLFDHMRRIFEALTIDSASNERASAADTLLSTGTFAPRLRHVLLDSSHKGRRLLARPWKADGVLAGVFGLFLSLARLRGATYPPQPRLEETIC